ncbi:MAG: hypothetical protein J7539_17890 [Niabella sp.]|nr:hypothetical protein [Niabella sp.]
MKYIKLFLACCSSICLISCHAQKENTKNNKVNTVVITKNFEQFNKSKYNKLKTGTSDLVSETLPDGTYIEMLTSNIGPKYIETQVDSYFSLLKIYYPNDNIKSKGAYFNVPWGGFKKGIWYQFDEKGNLIKEINYDKDYKFGFEQLLLFCDREKIPLGRGAIRQSTGYHTMIRRKELPAPDEARWTINWLKQSNVEETITLDGNTGKVLLRREQEYINN